MGTWGHGNFDSDCELDYLGTLCDCIEKEIEHTLGTPDLDVHTFLYDVMPRIAVLDALANRCSFSVAPSRKTVLSWRDRCLPLFDAEAPSIGIGDYYERRRAAIVETFESLAAVAYAEEG